jgi:hypothetical protein
VKSHAVGAHGHEHEALHFIVSLLKILSVQSGLSLLQSASAAMKLQGRDTDVELEQEHLLLHVARSTIVKRQVNPLMERAVQFCSAPTKSHLGNEMQE